MCTGNFRTPLSFSSYHHHCHFTLVYSTIKVFKLITLQVTLLCLTLFHVNTDVTIGHREQFSSRSMFSPSLWINGDLWPGYPGTLSGLLWPHLLITIKIEINCYNCHLGQLWLLNNTFVMPPPTSSSEYDSPPFIFSFISCLHTPNSTRTCYLLQYGIHRYYWYIFQSLITSDRGATGTYRAYQIYSHSDRIPQRATSWVPCALQEASFPWHWTKRAQECERWTKSLGI